MEKGVFKFTDGMIYPGEWFPWLKKEVEARRLEVFVPQFLEVGDPQIHNWVSKLAELVDTADESTYFTGCDMGYQIIACYPKALPGGVKVGGAFFIADFFKRLAGFEDNPDVGRIAKHWLDNSLDLGKVKSHLSKSIVISSDIDPYVPLDNQDDFRDKLGSEIITKQKMGHFGGDNDINKLPIVLESILKIAR